MKTQSRDIRADDFFALTSPRERMAFLLQYAVFAPSTHNSQPWAFRLGDGFCDILRKDDNPIVHADPKGRDLMISFGCLIENLVIATKYFKVFKSAEYVLEGDVIARVLFADLMRGGGDVDGTMRELLDATLYRVNARGIFENVPLDGVVEKALVAAPVPAGLHLHMVKGKAGMMKIAELTREGLTVAYKNPEFRKEMSQWVNNSASKKPTGIPGYSLRMPFLISFIFSWLVRNFNIGKRLGFLNYISIASAPAAMVIAADTNDERAWLDTGRYAERLMLQANALGHKTSIFTAAIEMGELYKGLQALVHTQATPQFVIVVGKINHRQRPNLRLSVRSKIIN